MFNQKELHIYRAQIKMSNQGKHQHMHSHVLWTHETRSCDYFLVSKNNSSSKYLLIFNLLLRLEFLALYLVFSCMPVAKNAERPYLASWKTSHGRRHFALFLHNFSISIHRQTPTTTKT